jgi:dipeptidyl aminopeptidase/acylaminoacyl peptidase
MLRNSFRLSLCFAFAVAAVLPAAAADAPKKRDITLDDLARLQRVGSAVVSPEGDWVLYTVSQIDTKEDKSVTHLWMVKWDGSVRLQLTFDKEGASAPRFSPDGRYISFLSPRPGPAKGTQVWALDRRGGEAQQMTAITDRTARSCSSPCIRRANRTPKRASRLPRPSRL